MLHSDRLAQTIAQSSKLPSAVYKPISHVDAARLSQALSDDAKAIAHASLATFFEGINGVSKGRFTWSTVQLYYCSFYTCRALLMLRSFSVFYIGRSPHSLIAQAGESVVRKSGNTHSVVLAEFRSRFSADQLLSQTVAESDPLTWLENLRNTASYRTAPFRDPVPPQEFEKPYNQLRTHLQAYVGSDKLLYSFDPDHAIICYPLLLLSRLNQELNLVGNNRIDVSPHYVSLLSECSCYCPELKNIFSSFNLG